jgi:hypothetical protein
MKEQYKTILSGLAVLAGIMICLVSVSCVSQEDTKQDAENKRRQLKEIEELTENFKLYVKNKDPQNNLFVDIQLRPDSDGNGGSLYIVTSDEWDRLSYRERLQLVQIIGKSWHATVTFPDSQWRQKWGYTFFQDRLGLETGRWFVASGATVPQE